MNDIYQVLRDFFDKPKGFIQHLPMEILELKQGYMKVLLKPDEMNGNPFGTVHGGCFFAVADTVAGTAAMTYGNYVTTTTGHIHYLNGAAVDKPLVVETTEVKAGKQLMTYDVTFSSEDGVVMCKVTLEYYVMGPILLESE